MNRVRNASAGQMPPLRALVVTAALLGAATPAVAQVPVTVSKPADISATVTPAKLTLETASPRPVPPPPRIQTPKAVKAPPRFNPPQPIEPPPPPVLGEIAPVPPPPPVVGAPPPQVAARPPEGQPAPAAPKPAPAAKAAPTQSAALPPPPAPSSAPSSTDKSRETLSVVFDGAAADLPETAEPDIAALAERMRANEGLRLQLRSYASGTPETAREARQLSLARALALRERLTALGIRSTRIDIRALGSGTAEGPPDRIDVEFLN